MGAAGATNDDLRRELEALRARLAEVECVEAQRKRSEEVSLLAQFTVDQCAMPTFWIGPDARVLHVNDAACRSLGYSRQELTSMAVHEFDLDVPQAKWAGHWRELKRRGTMSFESRHRSKGEKIFRVEIFANYLEFKGREYNVAFARDITERKETEEALRKERDFSNSLLQASPTFFVAISAQGSTLMMNEAMLTTLGYTEEEVVGTNYLETFVPEADRELLGGIFDKLVHSREPTLNENRVLTKDGRELLVEWRGRSVLSENGQFDFFFGVGIDVTERRKAEKEKANVEAQLRHAHKMQAVGQLAAGVAHDFNSILTVILSNAERALSKLTHEQLEGTVGTGLHQIVESVERGAALVKRLLTFGRAHTGNPQKLELARAVADVERMLRPLIGDEIEVVVTAASEVPPIYADLRQIEEVILNLVLNARDAMPDGGRLTIETTRVACDQTHAGANIEAKPGPHAMLAVSDTGVGMTAETLQRLFEPFFSTKPMEKGTGLGLSIVHGIVAQAGGHIEVTSEPGTGTTFRVYFPAAE